MSGRKTEIPEVVDQPITAVPPKKRGRPPKNAAVEDTSKHRPEKVTDDTAKIAKTADDPAPKKRGRPKAAPDVAKASKADGAANAVINDAVKRTAEPKKPGKAKRAEAAEAVSNVSAEPAPKKRGRPKKNADTADGATKKEAAATSEKKQESAKKPRAAKAKEASSAADKKLPEISSKTPQVMRLVRQSNDMVNPTIMAGKSSIPRKLRGLEPLTRIMKREADELFGTDSEAETYNITALVIDENAAEILRRFNACDCELCIEQLSQLTADEIPARFAKLKPRSVELNAPEVEELKAPLRRPVTSCMIRLVIRNKKRSYHD